MGASLKWPEFKTSADPARAEKCWNRLAGLVSRARATSWSPVQRQLLATAMAGSEYLGELLLAHPEWVTSSLFDPEYLRHPRQKQGLRREMEAGFEEHLERGDYEILLKQLREFRQREMFRIAARDLNRLGAVEEHILEISNVADICLDGVLTVQRHRLEARLGRPYHRDADGAWQPTQFSIIGLGKLGGQELNYSSDVDVIFLYDDEGHVFKQPPGKTDAGQGMSSHQFFARLAESVINEVSRVTQEGRLFRIDLRLRPEGKAGPLVRSLASYENYYAQWGQIWERMMLIKARGVAGDPSLAGEFLEMTQPFRYPRSLGERALREVAAMKQRIEQEVIREGEEDRNIKLSRGGIREIEFSVQVLQILHGGRIPFLQERRTLAALAKLVEYNLMSEQEGRRLGEAYRFLRELEHRLQMEANLQTHTLPSNDAAIKRLARLMEFRQVPKFQEALERHRGLVREVFDKVVKTEKTPVTTALPQELIGHEAEWRTILANHRFRDPDKAVKLLTTLVHGPGYVHISRHTMDLALQLLPRLLALCPQGIYSDDARLPSSPPKNQPTAKPATGGTSTSGTSRILSDPDRVLARLDSYVSAYGARAMMFETWASHSSLFELLLLLFDRSEFLAELAIRTPDLVDELALSGRLQRLKTAEETLKDLRYGLEDADQYQWIRRYHPIEQMRIGLRDILGLSDFEQNLSELTSLAQACLQYALDVVLKKHRLKHPPFAVIGLGKLGGAELTYGSDLDVVFVAPNKVRDLPKLQRMAVELMDLLGSQTESGTVFQVDARLRPDGAKGLLVNTLKAYEDYYRQRALLWEIQALSRARFVAGDFILGNQFEALATRLCNFQSPSLPLAAFKPQWKAEIARMRHRIEKERTPAGQETLAFKTGAGGLIDAEFMAQTISLACGWHEPNTLKALKRARSEKVLNEIDAASLLENYGHLQRLECILRRWSYVGESVLPVDPAPQYRVAVRCGFPDAATFLQAVSDWRAQIRGVYSRFFS
ncbi:MAG TPA: hypothetical protein P5186_23650 [Candidatus Paceibacterota bacterium]|nr:hypothetical protein [Verrucomicrobiota bacterium]HRY51054.1 hypothetical protein [Candidatus Paceibacterota bacterium]HRZ99447.1 hypothetical protein [Candidatus Paceibacterota bacterium]